MRIVQATLEHLDLLAPLPAAKRRETAYRRAAEICDEDVEICRRIGENGLGLIRRLKPKGDRINALTHCNAGWLATVDWGTATSPIYQAHAAGLLPDMSLDEALESAAVASLEGRFNLSDWGRRPTRQPHHTASAVALVGGGSPPRPGEISLAHHGVLFLVMFETPLALAA